MIFGQLTARTQDALQSRRRIDSGKMYTVNEKKREKSKLERKLDRWCCFR